MRGIRLGDHWVISDISGFKFPASEICSPDCHVSEWNPPHPQLKIRAIPDNQAVSNVRLRVADNFPAQITQDDL